MSDPENFLARWSRRKRETAEPPDENDEAPSPAASADPAADPQHAPSPVASGEGAAPAVDLSRLPSIESITAETDIRAFFAPGVPAELRLAALRRAWVADPQVRDFVGLADYDFDFNTPGAIAGFGPLEMTDDEVRRQVARIVGDVLGPEGEVQGTGEPSPQTAQLVEAIQEINAAPESPKDVAEDRSGPHSIDGEVPPVEQGPEPVPTHRSEEFAALQQTIEPRENLQTSARRSHGGALPK